jgi:hypothetical protein
MERTKLVVERRGTAWFAGNIELRFETSYYTWRRHPGVDWETQKLLGLGSRCIYLRDCTTCRRKFLGAPTACYCSEECRHPAKLPPRRGSRLAMLRTESVTGPVRVAAAHAARRCRSESASATPC